MTDKSFLTNKRLQRFEAIQRCLVPRFATLSKTQQLQSQSVINQLLSHQHPNVLKRLKLFLLLIDLTSFFIGGKTFQCLPNKKQMAVMRFFFDNPIGLLRKGFWGLNTLAKAGVYGQPGLYHSFGYRVAENPKSETIRCETVKR